MTIKSLLLFLFVFCFLKINGQTPGQGANFQSGKIIPPSPTVAALGKYGDIPVSFYNGTPNIAIPLYNISTIGHSLKIGLNYDASGIKVAQDASWVGLGWSLNAGGVISRTVRQRDDFDNNGYYFAAGFPQSGNEGTVGGISYLDAVYNGTIDAEPDIYSYNFNGYTGRFILGKKADGSPIFMDEKNNLDITYIKGGWVITTGDGYKYVFSTVERAQDYYRSASFDMQPFSGISGLNMNIDSSPITGWYLDSITAPTLETVKFEYVKGKSLSLINRSETFCTLVQITATTCENTSPTLPGGYHSYDVNRQELKDVYLNKIIFNNGSVEFNTSERKDIEYLDGNDGLLKPSKLDNILIKNLSGTLLKKYEFYYSYFNGTDPGGRLKLDSLIEKGSDLVKKPGYKFTYNERYNLPDKNSKSVDHWGYFNGVSNGTLLPTTSIPAAAQSFSGADRSQDTLNNYPANGILEAIKYPTGGTTRFQYELNSYSNTQGDQKYKLVDRSAYVRSNPDIYPKDDETAAQFTIKPDPERPSDNVAVTIQCSYQKVNQSVSDLVSLGYSNMWRILPDMDRNVAGCTTANYDQPNRSPSETNKNFEPGNYRMLVQSIKGWSTFMSIRWKERVLMAPEEQKKGGGIRVKTITDIDQNGNQTVRNYVYKTDKGTSSGILLGSPKYDVSYQVSQNVFNPPAGSSPGSTCSYTGLYTQITSGSLYPSGLSSKSGIVGYSKVTELLGNNGENGRTEYYYNNEAEIVANFPGVPTVAKPLNGKLSSVLVYDAKGNPVKSNIYKYDVKEVSTIKGMKLFTSRILNGDGNLANKPAYYYNFYDNNSYWAVQKSDNETTFNGTTGVSSLKSFYFDNNVHRELTKLEVNRSEGKTLVTKFLRPGDYAVTGGSSFIEKMIGQHNITPVIEEQNYVNTDGVSSLVSGTFSDYKIINDSFYKPGRIYRTELTYPSTDFSATAFQADGQFILDKNYKVNMYLDTYDSFGNILSMHKANGTNEIYLWGYNSQYPVAKIIDADYNAVKTNVTQTILDNPSSDQKLRDHLANLRLQFPGALITTYTYDPLVGITSETDAKGMTIYYEYDSFQRLKNIKDQNKNIIKKYIYSYLSPPATVYSNDAQQGEFTKSNCPAGQIGTSVGYSIAAGTITSIISKADANNKAIVDLQTKGQANANTYGTCNLPPVTVYSNTAQSTTFTKNDCPSGQSGSLVVYTVAAGTYTSTISQADAENKAAAEIQAKGQANANVSGTCKANQVPVSFVISNQTTTDIGFNLTINGANRTGPRSVGKNSSTSAQINVDSNGSSTVEIPITSGQVWTATISGFFGSINGAINGAKITFSGVNLSSAQSINIVLK
ncbi:hypothetical protein HDF26_003825 [Pedobacter cryoconitis]|uniref:DUF5977 domain-containing protein n=1 Tax=Pedobacter cryoconitis TaxID=188932 RepID=UPI0016111641|nr:DUF5977 domain-containing protein [Pedobacter cryoconitis]MBB6273365.1 hypothetical protein [Pedobacter cryoconitis]